MNKRLLTTVCVLMIPLSALSGCNQSPSETSVSTQVNTTNVTNNTMTPPARPSNVSDTTAAHPPTVTFHSDVKQVIDSIHSHSADIVQTIHATIQGQPYGKGMDAVAFVSASTGYLVGQGIVLKTTDGGRIFRTATQTKVDLQGASATGGTKGTVVAWGKRTILISHDGGGSWMTDTPPSVKGSIQSVDFVSSSEGFAVIGDGYRNDGLLRTTDGGSHWQKLTTPGQIISASFGSTSVGWVGTVHGDIYETKDSGNDWTRVFHPNVKYPGRPEVHAVSATACWAMMVGESGMSQTSYSVFRTQDGTDWKPVLGVGTAGAGPAPDNATHAPKGPSLAPGPMVALNTKQAVVSGLCYACNMGTAQVAATGDGGSTWTTYPTVQDGMSVPASLSFVNLQDGWMLDGQPNHGRILLHTTDGGRSWREVYPMVHPHPVASISFLNPTLGYGLGVPGDANAVLKTTNGGYTWQQIATLPVHPVKGLVGISNDPIYFVDHQLGFAVGSDGVMYASRDGGQTWTRANVPTLKSRVQSITFLSNGECGLAVAWNGQAAVTTDGGSVWHTITAKNSAQMSIYFAGLAHAVFAPTYKWMITNRDASLWGIGGHQAPWILGNNDQSLYIASGDGLRWNEIALGKHGPMPATVDFVNRKDGWFIGEGGSLYRTVDGGKTWVHASHVRMSP